MQDEEDSARGERVIRACEGYEVLKEGGPVPGVVCSSYLGKCHSQRQGYLDSSTEAYFIYFIHEFSSRSSSNISTCKVKVIHPGLEEVAH